MVGGGNPFYLKFWVKATALRWSEIADFHSIFARSASAVTPSEKVHLTLIGVYYALFNEPKMIIVRCL